METSLHKAIKGSWVLTEIRALGTGALLTVQSEHLGRPQETYLLDFKRGEKKDQRKQLCILNMLYLRAFPSYSSSPISLPSHSYQYLIEWCRSSLEKFQVWKCIFLSELCCISYRVYLWDRTCQYHTSNNWNISSLQKFSSFQPSIFSALYRHLMEMIIIYFKIHRGVSHPPWSEMILPEQGLNFRVHIFLI